MLDVSVKELGRCQTLQIPCFIDLIDMLLCFVFTKKILKSELTKTCSKSAMRQTKQTYSGALKHFVTFEANNVIIYIYIYTQTSFFFF